MNILQALKQGQSQGRAIRRNSWPPAWQVWNKNSNRLRFTMSQDSELKPYEADMLDIQAMDWELSTTMSWKGVNLDQPKPLNCKGNLLIEIHFDNEEDLNHKKALAKELVDELESKSDPHCLRCRYQNTPRIAPLCMTCVFCGGENNHYIPA